MRASEEIILQKRKMQQCTVLVTGGTGFIGSHIWVELLKQGYHVILLCRSKNHLKARERIWELQKWFHLNSDQIHKLTVIEGSIEKQDFGLGNDQYKRLTQMVDEVFHCAASTSFAERNRKDNEKINIESLKNVIHLGIQGRCYFFHHLSTVYSAGKREDACREEFLPNKAFYNCYEETKHWGEKIVLDSCSQHGIRANIYRPSIIYGNSRNGKSLKFNALYYPVKAVLFLKHLYLKDIQENNGKKAALMGVKMEDDWIVMPIRVEKKAGGKINLIPIDYFVDASMAIMKEGTKGDIYHIVSTFPKDFAELAEYTKRMFKIKGIRLVDADDFKRRPRNTLETALAHHLLPYKPYLLDNRVFLNPKAESILKANRLRCPDLDYDTYRKCMEYALEVEWGKKLFG